MVSGHIRLPRILVIRLNRVKYDGQFESRVNCSVDFPDSLDLSDSGKLLYPDQAVDYHGVRCASRYRLFSVVTSRSLPPSLPLHTRVLCTAASIGIAEDSHMLVQPTHHDGGHLSQ